MINDNLFLFIFLRFIYLFREREAETQAEGEAGSTQEARCGTRFRVSSIIAQAEGGAKSLDHRGCPGVLPFDINFRICYLYQKKKAHWNFREMGRSH